MPNNTKLTIPAKSATTSEEITQYKRYRTLIDKIDSLETRLESLARLQKQMQEENDLSIKELQHKLITSQL